MMVAEVASMARWRCAVVLAVAVASVAAAASAQIISGIYGSRSAKLWKKTSKTR